MQKRENTKIFRRIACAMMASAMLLSFTACSKNKDSSSSEPSSSSSEVSISNPVKEPSSSASAAASSKPSSQEKTVDPPKTVKESITKAKEQNSDVVGWLKVPNTKIDNEVLQSTNNDYYLRRDITKNYNWYGCYYADMHNIFKTRNELSPNTVIYGHNMEDRPNGKKFAQLFNYLNEDFAKKNPYIYLTTPDDEMVFQIYAVYYTEKNFGYHHTNTAEENGVKGIRVDDIATIIKGGKERSEYIYDVDVNDKDKLLTLSTCTYKYGGEKNEEQRFVVQARLIRPGEEIKETVSLKKNPSPKAPVFSKEYK